MEPLQEIRGLEIHAGLLPEEKARLIERERKEGNGAAMASPSQEAQKIDLQIGNHRLRENQLLDVPRPSWRLAPLSGGKPWASSSWACIT